MFGYIVRRVAIMIPVALITITLLYGLFFALPGNVIEVAYGGSNGKAISASIKKNLEEKFDLDKPLYIRYARYLKRLSHGDLGVSVRSPGRQVWDEMKQRVPASFRLAAWALAIEAFVGILIGVIAAVFRFSFWDVLTTVTSTMLVGLPVFVAAFILQYTLGVLPAQAGIPAFVPVVLIACTVMALIISCVRELRKRVHVSTRERLGRLLGGFLKWWIILIIPIYVLLWGVHRGAGLFEGQYDYPKWYQMKVEGYPTKGWFLFFFPKADGWRYLALPAVTLAATFAAITSRITRSSMLEIMEMDFIRTARAKGVPNRQVILKHALRNALIPVVTVLALDLGVLIGSAIVTETVYSWPGLGNGILRAIGTRDFNLAMAITLVMVMFYLTANLVVDILYGVLDPRVRRSLGTEVE